MGSGRLLWTLRRPFFYGVVVLLFVIFYYGVDLSRIIQGTFSSGRHFNLFYAYLFWSIPGLVLMMTISVLSIKLIGELDSVVLSLGKFLFEDLISPFLNIYQFCVGIFLSKIGRDVDWGGCIWDMIWTVACAGFILWGLTTQI